MVIGCPTNSSLTNSSTQIQQRQLIPALLNPIQTQPLQYQPQQTHLQYKLISNKLISNKLISSNDIHTTNSFSLVCIGMTWDEIAEDEQCCQTFFRNRANFLYLAQTFFVKFEKAPIFALCKEKVLKNAQNACFVSFSEKLHFCYLSLLELIFGQIQCSFWWKKIRFFMKNSFKKKIGANFDSFG